jgi:hypothetical protein
MILAHIPLYAVFIAPEYVLAGSADLVHGFFHVREGTVALDFHFRIVAALAIGFGQHYRQLICGLRRRVEQGHIEADRFQGFLMFESQHVQIAQVLQHVGIGAALADGLHLVHQVGLIAKGKGKVVQQFIAQVESLIGAVAPLLLGLFLCLEFAAPQALCVAARPGTKGQIVNQGLVETGFGQGLQIVLAPGVQVFGFLYCLT